jgi:hypothetical protein
LPKSFVALKQENAAKGGDPATFSCVSIPGGKTRVYFPETIPEDKRDDRLKTLGLLIEIAEFCDFEVYVTRREIDPTLWTTLDALKDTILGAYYCLCREKISPVDNVPKQLKAGWELIQWYAYSKGANDTNAGDYLKIPRVVSLISTSGTAWGSNKQFTDLVRITALLRLAGGHASKKLDDPKKFLKGEGYFLEKYAGKKPIGGLFADEELTLVVQNWTTKSDSIRTAYKRLPDKFRDLPQGGISVAIAAFNIRSPQMIKNIDDAKSKRVANLLVSTGRGRNQTKEISKGGNLPEKLLAINGGDSVRTIGKVMWSPLYEGTSQNEFADIVMRNANSMLQRNGLPYIDVLLNAARDVPARRQEYERLEAIMAPVGQATQVYLECIPDHQGNQAWDSVFPNRA